MELIVIIVGATCILGGLIYVLIGNAIHKAKRKAVDGALHTVGLGSEDMRQYAKEMGIDNESIKRRISDANEQNIINKIVKDYPNYTPDMIKNEFDQIIYNMVNAVPEKIDPSIYTKITSDQKLAAYKTYTYTSGGMTSYMFKRLTFVMAFTDGMGKKHMLSGNITFEDGAKLIYYGF